MADIPLDMQSGEGSVESGGYQQELKRTLGSFQMFAISFAFISVAVGIFGTYDVVLQRGGPVGIWLWVLVAVGQLLVALVYAQFAARIPLSGSSYQWASRLASPKIGLGFGWLTTCYLAIAVVAVDNALAQTAFMPLFGIQPDEHIARLITVVVLLIQVVLVVVSARLASMVNCCGCHGPGLTGEPGVSGCHSESFRLFHRRWRADGRHDHGPRHPRRLRLRGEPCRGG
jgi:amino acid permease